MGRKEPGPYNPGKTWPGEAHKQPQLATQYYLRARSEECTVLESNPKNQENHGGKKPGPTPGKMARRSS